MTLDGNMGCILIEEALILYKKKKVIVLNVLKVNRNYIEKFGKIKETSAIMTPSQLCRLFCFRPGERTN
jgi:RNase P subunit RPR2